MVEENGSPAATRHYFVDEAGDGTLFGRRGKVLVGTPGCSRFFILGFADITDPTRLACELASLRAHLLADPYFAGVPSMQPGARKTALAFHAKDDVPEVRREVFSLLLRPGIRFFAVVKSKLKLLEYVRQRNQRDPEYRYSSKELYDHLVKRLFKEQLHKDARYRIYFSRRWKADRTEALRRALHTARARFAKQHGILSTAPIHIEARSPRDCACLQVVDYFLWALQRLYERREDRFVKLLWPMFRLVHDIDDTREAPYGVYYAQKKPLILAALEGLQEI